MDKKEGKGNKNATCTTAKVKQKKKKNCTRAQKEKEKSELQKKKKSIYLSPLFFCVCVFFFRFFLSRAAYCIFLSSDFDTVVV